MQKLDSPLRYPGSKLALAPLIARLLYLNDMTGRSFVETHTGSASVSLYLLNAGIIRSARLIEKDPLLYAFWKVVFEDTDALIKKIKEIEVNMDTWHAMRHLLAVDSPADSDIIDLAFAGFFLNRTNFSGVLHAGPIGGISQSSDYPIDCRYNKEMLCGRIRQVSTWHNKVEVVFGDAVQELKSAVAENDNIYYVDPPYYAQGRKLYRFYYELSDHAALAKELCKLDAPWILSYDDHHVIEHLYSGCTKFRVGAQYMVKSRKSINELIVTNLNPLDVADFEALHGNFGLQSYSTDCHLPV